MKSEYLTLTHCLTAGETNAEGCMPVQLIARRAIEAATLHANALGIGYAELMPLRMGWVLARMSIEIYNQVAINDLYTITTWIEGYNRRFSERCFRICSSDGTLCAAVRSVWVAIDIDRRRMADLGTLPSESFPTLDLGCPVERMQPVSLDGATDLRETTHTFGYAELDFNRHVNAVRYLDVAMSQWDLEWHDAHSVGRFDIAYDHELLPGSTATVQTGTTAAYRSAMIIAHPDGRRAAAIAIKWRQRPNG